MAFMDWFFTPYFRDTARPKSITTLGFYLYVILVAAVFDVFFKPFKGDAFDHFSNYFNMRVFLEWDS